MFRLRLLAGVVGQHSGPARPTVMKGIAYDNEHVAIDRDSRGLPCIIGLANGFLLRTPKHPKVLVVELLDQLLEELCRNSLCAPPSSTASSPYATTSMGLLELLRAVGCRLLQGALDDSAVLHLRGEEGVHVCPPRVHHGEGHS